MLVSLWTIDSLTAQKDLDNYIVRGRRKTIRSTGKVRYNNEFESPLNIESNLISAEKKYRHAIIVGLRLRPTFIARAND